MGSSGKRSRNRFSPESESARHLLEDELENILRILRKATWKEKEEVAQLIGERRYKWAIPYLIDGLKWRGDKARNAAIKALVKIGQPSIPQLDMRSTTLKEDPEFVRQSPRVLVS